jgi:dipeptidyl aminopeptidase/acylaminoacyl peptidase
VFEPFRGWIFFADGQGISAIDPENPSSRRVVLENPEGISSHVAPVGWSADGSKLMLVDEGESGLWVMDSSGSLTHVSGAGGCCVFVHSNLLSPDGTTAIPWQEGLGRAVWSADGTASALAVQEAVGRPHEVHTAAVLITDQEGGTTRQLDIPPVEIGHMAWSPDSEWLVVTAPGPRPRYWLASNPADTRGLYVARVDGSDARRISSGSYLAAAWSPDGTQIAALTSGRELWVMNADGSDPRSILGRAVLPPEWTGIAWQPQSTQP